MVGVAIAMRVGSRDKVGDFVGVRVVVTVGRRLGAAVGVLVGKNDGDGVGADVVGLTMGATF